MLSSKNASIQYAKMELLQLPILYNVLHRVKSELDAVSLYLMDTIKTIYVL
jgi:hypothetical protein